MREEYRDFVVRPVHQLYRQLDTWVAPEVAQSIKAALQADLGLTTEWARKLEGLYRERQAREMRGNIRAKAYEAAAANARSLIATETKPENRAAVAGYLGSILGSLENDQDKVDRLVRLLEHNPKDFGLNAELLAAVQKARDDRLRMLASMRVENRELEWNRLLVEATVEIKNLLPMPNEVGEPTEEEDEKFRGFVASAFNVVLFFNNPERLVDVSLLLAEFCPKELSFVGAQAGVEKRLYLTLGPKARRVADEVLARIGSHSTIGDLYLSFARTHRDTVAAQTVFEVLGALRNPKFFPLLMESLADKKYAEHRNEIIDSLGFIASEEAIESLLALLKEVCSRRLIDPPVRRRATKLLVALARISRSTRLTPPLRNQLVSRVTAMVPDEDLQLLETAAVYLFFYKPDQLEQSLIDWAVEALVKNLWNLDKSPEFEKGGERQSSYLGFRQRMVDTLVAIGERGIPTLIRAADRLSMRYSGAYYAIGELLQKIGNPDALPLLEKLITNAFMTDDNEANKYTKETYWDAANQARETLTKDQVIGSLVFALTKIGSKRADDLILHFYRQIQSGMLHSPGDETSRYLFDAAQRIQREGGSAKKEEPAQDEELRSDALVGGQPTDALDLLKDLSAFYFSSATKRKKKIPAMQELAQRRDHAAIQPILKHLTDKDAMIKAAASTALLEYGSPGVKTATFQLLARELIEALAGAKDDFKLEIVKLLRQLRPYQEPLRGVLKEYFDTSENGAIRAEASRLLREGESKQQPQRAAPQPVPAGAAPSVAGPQKTSPAESQPMGEKKMSDLEKKRAYLLARQEWIRGGKKGPPPQPPD
ncbi:MAG: HEAT repeat domain-containing protein [bacterium]